jgi:hypothetical protein
LEEGICGSKLKSVVIRKGQLLHRQKQVFHYKLSLRHRKKYMYLNIYCAPRWFLDTYKKEYNAFRSNQHFTKLSRFFLLKYQQGKPTSVLVQLTSSGVR